MPTRFLQLILLHLPYSPSPTSLSWYVLINPTWQLTDEGWHGMTTVSETGDGVDAGDLLIAHDAVPFLDVDRCFGERQARVHYDHWSTPAANCDIKK